MQPTANTAVHLIKHMQLRPQQIVSITGCCTPTRQCIRPQTPRRAAIAVAAAATARGGGGNGGGSGDDRPIRGVGPGDEGPSEPEGRRRPIWLKLTAAGLGSYVLLGLLQPWELLGRARLDTSQQQVAVIIPVLNEAAGIESTLQQLQQLQPPPAEIIVVDGGSTDDTVRLVRRSKLASRVLSCKQRGRAAQMNAGAAAASSDLLCFLHADTRAPHDLVSVMRQELADPRTVLCGFVPSIEVPGRRLWLLSAHNFIKTYYAPLLFRPIGFLRGLRALFGDQTMFCRASDFRRVGGFDGRLSIMEDADLCVRMHEAGPHPTAAASGSSSSSTACLDAKEQAVCAGCEGQQQQQGLCWRLLGPRGRIKQVLNRQSKTSGRRLAAWGGLHATYVHVRIGTAWYFGAQPEQLRRLYDQLYTDAFR